jgi:putative acetyltransferase
MIVGHILLSSVELHGEQTMRVLALAPMAVLPTHQRVGVGRALVDASIEKAEARREPLILVVGHADYYPRFGFQPARHHGIEPPWPDFPDDVWMVKPLSSFSDRFRGTVRYPTAFDLT